MFLFRFSKTCLVILFLSLICAGCATFSKKRYRKEIYRLNNENVMKINGIYEIHPKRRFYNLDVNSNDLLADSLIQNNAYFCMMNLDENKWVYDSLVLNEGNKIRLKLVVNKNLSIQVLKDTIILKETLLTGKVKNGMFYLNNRYLKCTGIPFLFGGCTNHKRRIGITKTGYLLINEGFEAGGGILLIFLNGYGYNETLEFRKIE